MSTTSAPHGRRIPSHEVFVPMTSSLPSLSIASGQKDYRVDFPADIDQLLGELDVSTKTVVLVDENVARIYREQLEPWMKQAPFLTVPATEDEKTLTGVERVLSFLQRHNATRQTTVIAIGGGIIQDIVNFSAHLYYRGLAWVFVPTTLLGMCDSCIGAKFGINFNGFKNQLGGFHSPSRVLVCLRFLETLSDTEMTSGYGEILKLLLTGPAGQFEFLRDSVEKEGLRNSQLGRLILESLKVKKGVIEEDEYERDLRRTLNYGHTFGHALEAITDHDIPHGKAVAWGVDLVNFISMKRGLLDPARYASIHDFIQKYFSHRLARAISAEQLIEASRRDKKVTDGKANLILLPTEGSLKIVPTIYDQQLTREVEEYLAGSRVLSWP